MCMLHKTKPTLSDLVWEVIGAITMVAIMAFAVFVASLGGK